MFALPLFELKAGVEVSSRKRKWEMMTRRVVTFDFLVSVRFDEATEQKRRDLL
jgi:hypothetical protein